MDRLLHPSSVAVVGASERPGSYSSETLLNLGRLGFEGEVWGVNPKRSTAHGRPCFPTLSDLPSSPDAVVVAIPAAQVPDVIEEAGAVGAGGAVVFAAGFAEAGQVELEDALRAAALRHGLPVCGPNCDGLIALHARAALWGDALAAPRPGHVALVSQSGNLVVNALATRRGLRLHTAVSSGNETVVSTPDWLEHLAREPGVRSIALLVEGEGDGARLCEALAVCAEQDVRVAVLKVGASARGAAAAAAHTGAVAGDHRVFRALVEEAGAAWAADVHDLLELAKALAVPRRPRPGGGLAILTCSGGDSGLGADEADRLGVPLPRLDPATTQALAERLPAAATVANPLDYTAMIWGEVETLRDLVRIVGDDPAIGHVLVFYDRPPGIEGAPAESWDAVERGILAGADVCAVPVMVAATLPELLDDDAAWRFSEAGVPAVGGLRTGVAVAAALRAPPGDAARLRSLERSPGPAGCWLHEHETKELLRAHGVPVPRGRVVVTPHQAAATFEAIGAPVALKGSGVLHKSSTGVLALGVRDVQGVRDAFERVFEGLLDTPRAVLVEEMVEPGFELLVAVRTDGLVPVLVLGLGGVHVEALDRVAVVPLPADEARIVAALASLRAPTHAAAVVQSLVEAAEGLALLECNPVIVHRDGAVVVDAIAQEVAT